MEPETRYARSSDVHIAYQVVGSGPPDVVIVPILGKRVHPDRVHTQYTTIGSGKVYVFQSGTVTEGTWSKASRNSQWELKDTSGKAIELDPGQTWFTITDAVGNVSYTP